MLKGAVLYWVIAFGAGFVLGTIRTIWIAPALGPLAAVAIEGPIMLTVCWFACAAALRWGHTPATASARIGMGALWLALLLASETALGLALGQGVGAQIAHFATADGALGLFWMAICAAFPLVQRPTPAVMQ